MSHDFYATLPTVERFEALADPARYRPLRAALVPVAWLRDRGHEVLVARHRVSPHYHQAALQWALHGGGAPMAESLLKTGGLPPEYRVAADPDQEPDFSGLECRWHEIPTRAEETIAVIVQATERAPDPLGVYRRVLDRIAAVYGDPESCRPVSEEGMRVAFSSAVLEHEARVRGWRLSAPGRLWYAIAQRLQAALGWLFFATGLRTRATDWSRYKADAVVNTDFRKLDGCLRLVLSGTAAQREELTAFLDELRRADTPVAAPGFSPPGPPAPPPPWPSPPRAAPGAGSSTRCSWAAPA